MKKNIDELVRLVTKETSTKDERSREKVLWYSLNPTEKKQTTESVAFVSCASSTGLVDDPLDCSNVDAPQPDIQIVIAGKSYYFELGEITDEGLAR